MADDETVETTPGKTPEAADGNEDWAASLDGQAGKKTPKTAGFEELSEGKTDKSGSQNLDFLLDIPLKVSVELGRSKMIINKLLQLTQGSVVELDKAAGEPVEILVNDKLLGKGEVIVINDRFGIRITEIISQADRIKSIA